MSASMALSKAPGRICARIALGSGHRPMSIPRYPMRFAGLARFYASKDYPPHTVVSMPALSPTMTSGNIGAWQKKVGDAISPGDVLVEIETDKAQMDFEFQEEGVLAKILKDSGEKDVAVGNPIAVMVEDAADASAFESFSLEDAGGDKEKPKSDAKQEAADSSEPAGQSTGTAPPGPEKAAPAPEAQESESTGEKLQPSIDREPGISPAVKKLALEKGVAIAQLKGSGPGGRVTKADVEKFQASPASTGSAAGAAGAPSYVDTPASSMRKTIATRLTQSMNENPHYFVSSSCSVSRLLALRQALNDSAPSGEGAFKLSVNDFLVKALATAARRVPAANSSWREEKGQIFIRQHNTVDISVAVATPIGLMTPIVKSAHALGLREISTTIKDLGKRARDGKLKPEEYQGGTMTISNMGMNPAIERFTAVINPPQACIVAVGAVKKVAVPAPAEVDGDASESDWTGSKWDEQIVLTASFDHKVVDGAVGGEFMRELKKVVENPLELML